VRNVTISSAVGTVENNLEDMAFPGYLQSLEVQIVDVHR